MVHVYASKRELLVLYLLRQLEPVQVTASSVGALMAWDEKTIAGLLKSLRKKGYVSWSGEEPVKVIHKQEVLGGDKGSLLAALESGEADGLPAPLQSCFLHCIESSQFEAIEDLLNSARHFASKRNYRALYLICRWCLCRVLSFKPSEHNIMLWQRFVDLCRNVHVFTLPYFDLGRQTVLMLYKARGMAYAIGDMRALASLDIIIGSEATRQFYGPGRSRLWHAGQRGKSVMATLSDWDMQTKLSLYLGILDFDQGHYQSAVGHLSLCQYVESGPEQDILHEISQLYQGHAAGLMANFSLGTSILRGCLRLASTHKSHKSQAMLKIDLCAYLLAQGHLEEPLELLDGVIACVSPRAEPELWACTCAILAYYHRMAGHLDKGYLIFSRCVAQLGKEYFSYFIYHMPFFIELLYAWDEAGFPPIPGCEFTDELQYRLDGHNEMLRAVCLRLKGQILQRGQDPRIGQQAVQALEQSLAIVRELGAARERAKSCVMLAKSYMEDNRKQAGLALAMEAWSLSHMLRQDPWIQILASLVPAQADAGTDTEALSAENFFDQLSAALMEEAPGSPQDFYAFVIKTVCRLFGVKRGCLLRAHESSNYFLVLSRLGISEEEINSRFFLPQSALVEKTLAGTPVFTAINNPKGEQGALLSVACIPILGRDQERYALYMDGDIIPQLANILTQETMLNISRMLAWEFVRFERGRSLFSRDGRISSKDDVAPYAIIYKSKVMRDFLDLVDHAAGSDASITIYGETGTGKELIARRIHAVSGRKGPFVAVNLSSMPEELFENEMFGHERGAFTGALQRRSGLVELADKGTLFIDEMPDISQRLQIKLLRLLQEKVFSRLGTTNLIRSDFRLVVATNRDIRKDVQEGRFREDLFYRICVIPLRVPPLRERKEDIEPILNYYLDIFCRRYQKKLKLNLDDAYIPKLLAHPWPGNVRELKNMVELAVIQPGENGEIKVLPLPDSPFVQEEEGSSGEAAPDFFDHEKKTPEKIEPFFTVARPSPSIGECASGMLEDYFGQLPSLREVEEGYISAVLQLTGGKIDGSLGAARVLGLKRSALYYRLDKMRSGGKIKKITHSSHYDKR